MNISPSEEGLGIHPLVLDDETILVVFQKLKFNSLFISTVFYKKEN